MPSYINVELYMLPEKFYELRQFLKSFVLKPGQKGKKKFFFFLRTMIFNNQSV